MATYFNFIPTELRMMIGSYYVYIHDFISLYKSDTTDMVDMRNILDVIGITNYKELYYYTFPEYYKVSLEKSQDDYTNNEYLYLLFYTSKTTSNTDIFMPLKYSNIIYKVKIKEQFPGLYKLMEDFDLSKGGSRGVIDFIYVYDEVEEYYTNIYNYQQWQGLYVRLNHILEKDWLPNELLKFRDTGELPINYIFKSDESIFFYDDFIVYLFYAMAFHPNFKFELQDVSTVYDLLISSYRYNQEIYLKMRELVPNKVYRDMLNDREIMSDINDIYDSVYERGRDKEIEFVEYIKSRANT